MQQDLRAVRLYTEHCQVERAMFCPDPNGPHTIKETVAKLIDMMKEVPPDSPRAKQLAGTIYRLQNLTERADPVLP
jgi:hypothetical protein